MSNCETHDREESPFRASGNLATSVHPNQAETTPPDMEIEASSASSRTFLEIFPIEIRFMIYKLLLVNPLLGKAHSVQRSKFSMSTRDLDNPAPGYQYASKYHLHPAILRVSKPIFEEASEVLYSPTFVLICTADFVRWECHFSGSCPYPASPITRHLDEDSFCGGPNATQGHTLRNIAAFAKVRYWKVLFCPFNYASSWANTSVRNQARVPTTFDDFCKAICDSSPKSLQIDYYNLAPLNNMHKNLTAPGILGHLAILRNVGCLKIRPIGENNFEDWNCSVLGMDRYVNRFREYPQLPGPYLMKMLKSLAESDKPVERLFEMNNALVAFAQSFERDEMIQLHMGMDPDRPDFDLEGISSSQRSGFRPWNPYKFKHKHFRHHYEALEENVELAYKASNRLDSIGFKRHRRNVVLCLQPHYRRLVIASVTLNTAIKKAKMEYAFLDPSPLWETSKEDLLYFEETKNDLVYLLHEYAEAFRRDQNCETRKRFHVQKRLFDELYSRRPREKILAALDGILKTSWCDLDTGTVKEFKSLFRDAVDDMDRQFFRIRRAWKTLFTKM